MKEEIFAYILKMVSRETDLTQEMIVSKCSKAEVVDARYILAKLLYDAGFYKSQIAERLRLSQRSVFVMLGNFDDRLKYNRMMRISYERIRKILGNFRNPIISVVLERMVHTWNNRAVLPCFHRVESPVDYLFP